jgi:DNA repair exonuclease SbcCD ATPase subunit
MAEKVKTPWLRILLIAAAGCVVIWLAGKLQSCGDHSAAIESLYQQVQANHQAELDRRLSNIKMIEAAQAVTAADYQARIDQLAAAADAKVKALKWKSNEQLAKEKAAAAEILGEKKKAENALGIMTQDRDDLKAAAEVREKEVADERNKLKTEQAAALKKLQDKLDTCEQARTNASGHPTWISIGPGGQAFLRNGTVEYRWGINFQIPVIRIKSPFKRF